MYLDSITLKILHQERVDEMSKLRLAQEIQEAQRSGEKNFNPALAWVGQRMMDIGAKLAGVSDEQKPSLN